MSIEKEDLSKSVDLKVCLDKAKELLEDKNSIQKELNDKNRVSAWVNTETYKLEIKIVDKTKGEK